MNNDEDISTELSQRAKNFVKVENERIDNALKKLKVKDDLYDFSDLSKSSILTLAENNIKTLDELAELDSGELFAILGNKVFINEDAYKNVVGLESLVKSQISENPDRFSLKTVIL